MFITPIPIGSSPVQQPTNVQENDGVNTAESIAAAEKAQRDLQEADAHALAKARARRAGTGMLGTLLDIRA